MPEIVNPSFYLRNLTQNQRFIVGLCFTACLPISDLSNGKWNDETIAAITKLLDLPDGTLCGHLSEYEQRKLPPSEYIPWNERIAMCRAELPNDLQWRFDVFKDLFILYSQSIGYDARAKISFRLMSAALELSWFPQISALESMLAEKLFERMHSVEYDTGKSEDKWRYLKIGAAAVGGGALLAVTGGLAAPALAAGIAASGAVLGTATAATLSVYATVPIIASLFGATGVGLLGYKMNVRTKGLTEFNFEREGDSHCMSVCICISGLLRDKYDSYRAWGIDPKNLPADERLQRYFQIFDPPRVNEVLALFREYKGRETVLCRNLKYKYGYDPRRPISLSVAKKFGSRQSPIAQNSVKKLTLKEEDVDSLVNTVLKSTDSSVSTANVASANSDKEKNVTKKRSTNIITSKILERRKSYSAGRFFKSHDVDDGKDDSMHRSYGSFHIKTDDFKDCTEKEDSPVPEFDQEMNNKVKIWFWDEMVQNTEQYILVWESSILVSLGKSVMKFVKDMSVSALQQGLKFTALSAVVTAITWPVALISLSDLIDSDWTVGCERADKAGKALADILLSKKQGSRPVSLFGFSLGARLIFTCLEEMARRHKLWEEMNASLHNVEDGLKVAKNEKFSEAACAAGIIENAFLFGAPVTASKNRWESISLIVHGRLVNGYSKTDAILSFLYRIKRLSLNVAGLQEIQSHAVENIDLSQEIVQHMHYCTNVPEILRIVNVDDCTKYVPRNIHDVDISNEDAVT